MALRHIHRRRPALPAQGLPLTAIVVRLSFALPRITVRIYLILVLLGVAVAGGACANIEPQWFGAPSQPVAERPYGWRRTAQGWEKAEYWWTNELYTPSAGARVWPASVAALELTLSVAALSILTRRGKF
jgi:hypothetical protein